MSRTFSWTTTYPDCSASDRAEMWTLENRKVSARRGRSSLLVCGYRKNWGLGPNKRGGTAPGSASAACQQESEVSKNVTHGASLGEPQSDAVGGPGVQRMGRSHRGATKKHEQGSPSLHQATYDFGFPSSAMPRVGPALRPKRRVQAVDNHLDRFQLI